ncbi:heat-inducible transcriptional repressor HrcA [Salinicoccus albus]|uniref:heat-inducible transcriptional repressor HrcA n=1 Tax=Salinicoccus albus TaxID=418756 RepID=UPI00036AA313|nr:heat-inducible transcriptional repressor HrcA [Salinicoccus albus]
MSILTSRQEIILFSVVDDFLNVMMPISSKHLIDKYNLDISSATVRNEMAKLESMGFLTKPHTSAGRIPSRPALRHYVKMLADKLERHPEHNSFSFNTHLSDDMKQSERSQFLADAISGMTSYLTQVSLSQEDELVKGMYLTPITVSTLLVIIVLETGNIKKVPINMDEGITITDLEKLSNELNSIVINEPLSRISMRMQQKVTNDRVNVLVTSIIEGVSEGISNQKLISGRSGFNHLMHQISRDVYTLQHLYDDMESDQLNDIIDLNTIDNVDVYFGDELKRDYDSISVITTNFDILGQRGNLMIIGPEIMSYKEVIRLLYSFRNQEPKGSDCNGRGKRK